jgi:hypothetical protein
MRSIATPLLMASIALFTACKTRAPASQSANTTKSNNPLNLSDHQIQIASKLGVEFTQHLARFQTNQLTSHDIKESLSKCDHLSNSRREMNSLLDASKKVTACDTMSNDTDVNHTLNQLKSLKRSKTFEQSMYQFNEHVLPTLLEQLPNLVANKETPFNAQSVDSVLDVVSDLAIMTGSLAKKIQWKPGLLNAARYTHTVLYNELSKPNESDIKWDIVINATDTFLSIIPFTPDDAGVNPLTVAPTHRLYGILYGPNAHGPAYWSMVAAVTLRKSKFFSTDFDFSTKAGAIKSIKTMLTHTALETKDDQQSIKQAVALLIKHQEKFSQ